MYESEVREKALAMAINFHLSRGDNAAPQKILETAKEFADFMWAQNTHKA